MSGRLENNKNGLLDARGHDDASTGSARRLTTSTRPNGQSVYRLIKMFDDRRVGLSLRVAPLWGSQGRGYGDESFSVAMKSWAAWLRGIALIQKSPNWLRDFSL